MPSTIDDVAVPLGVAYLAAAVVSLVQLSRLASRRISASSSTVKIHASAFVLLGLRSLFFFLCDREWDVSTGVVKGSEAGVLSFLIFDETATMLGFVLYLIVACFYIELYYFAVDRSQRYERVLRPGITVATMAVLATQVLLWALLASTWGSRKRKSTSSAYAPEGCAALAAVLNASGAATFPWFAFVKVSRGLREVPTELMMRRRLVTEVRLLAAGGAATMGARSLILILVAGRRVYVEDAFAAALVAAYFLLLEAIPVLVILYFFRRMPLTADWSLDGLGGDDGWTTTGGESEEVTALLAGAATANPKKEAVGATSSSSSSGGGGAGGDDGSHRKLERAPSSPL
jgi:hypothetical protein